MFRMWGKIFKDQHLLEDRVWETFDLSASRTSRVLSGLEGLCMQFDLPVPIWLDKNIKEFKRGGKTRFSSDNFVEETAFDYLEIEILSEE